MELCNNPKLMDDVWITLDGIQALLKWDQYEEEQIHLSIEADNLCHFFGDELAVLKLALQLPETSLASFTSQVNKALDVATTLSGALHSMTLLSINASTLAALDPEGGDEFPIADPDHSPPIDSEHAVLADVLEGQMGMLELDNDDNSTDYRCKANTIIFWDLSENLLVNDFSIPKCEPILIPGPGKVVA
ncbi:hypothetical protein BDR04DRAFT_1160725 [Suillus decipiens]|nr:hypothetical protein BDR04DRAFT_1160725 [Suillus decipiens]